MNWDTLFADRTRLMKRSTVREILKLTAHPEVISFAGGLPAPDLFPIERIEQAVTAVLAERGRAALQYSTSEGMPELRQWIARRLSDGGRWPISPDQVLITGGAQQAIDMLGRVFLNDGDRVLVENPTYIGMLVAWRPYRPTFTAVPTDHDGLIVEALADRAADDHKLMYSVPTFQNPQGTTLTAERRAALAELIVQRGLIFVEDDPYSALRYSGAPIAPVLHYEAQARGSTELNGNVIYCGTFSKILAPGLRIGYVVAADPVIDRLVQVKQATDLHTGTLAQFITYELVRDEAFLNAHIERLRTVYRERRDLMLQTMEETFPDGVTWTRPEGGLFIMVTLPPHLNAREVLALALDHNVAFVPCDDFFIGGTGHNTFRLNFSNASPERIVEGVRRLASVMKEVLLVARA